MMHDYAKFACIVSASKADVTRYWAVASSPQQAIVAAQLILGHEWIVALAYPRLKPPYLERLKLHADEIRELLKATPSRTPRMSLASADLRCSMACPAKVLAIELEGMTLRE
jgi:hypothetical protein